MTALILFVSIILFFAWLRAFGHIKERFCGPLTTGRLFALYLIPAGALLLVQRLWL